MAKRIFDTSAATVIVGARLTPEQAREYRRCCAAVPILPSELSRRLILMWTQHQTKGAPNGEITS